MNVDGKVEVTNALVGTAGVSGFNAAAIKTIALVVDDPNATTGTLSITTTGLAFTPVITTTTTNASAGGHQGTSTPKALSIRSEVMPPSTRNVAATALAPIDGIFTRLSV